MHDLRWDRQQQVDRVRDRLWTVLSPAAIELPTLVPLATTLLQLPRRDRRWLSALHLVLSPEAAALLADARLLVRHLTSATTPVLEQHPERVRGSVDWSATVAESMRQARRWAYVTAPRERDYSTPENRLLSASLRAVAEAAGAVGWQDTGSGVGGLVVERGVAAEALLAGLATKRVPPGPAPSDLRRAEAGRAARRFRSVTSLWRLHRQLVVLQDPTLLRRLVESTALVLADDAALFEVLVLLDVLQWLRDNHWEAGQPTLLRGQILLGLHRGPERLTVHLQQVPRQLSQDNRYQQVLRAHGLRLGALRPDLVLVHEAPGRVARQMMIEVKQYRSAADGLRAALGDLLAYQRAFRSDALQGLGVAFGVGLRSATSHGIGLCTPDHLGEALEVWLAGPRSG